MSDKAFPFLQIPRSYIQRSYAWCCLQISVWSLHEFYYGKSIKHLDIITEEHIGVSPLAGKKVNRTNNIAVRDQLFHCNYLPPFEYFCILSHESQKHLLEIKIAL